PAGGGCGLAHLGEVQLAATAPQEAGNGDPPTGRAPGGPMIALKLALGALLAASPLAAQTRDTTAKGDSAPNTGLVREQFAYEGGGRDPFISLLKSGDVRPLIADLKLVTVVYDGVYPARS